MFGVWYRDRCLGVVWRLMLGCGFAVGLDQRGFLLVARGDAEGVIWKWVCLIFGFCKWFLFFEFWATEKSAKFRES